jgi:hypothetical protein
MVTEIKQFEEVTSEPPDELVAHQKEFTDLVPVERSAEANLGSSIADEILLGSLRDGRLNVRSPITVRLSVENEDIIAEAAPFNEFGFGKNFSEALADLQRAIAELYFTLETEQGHMSDDLQGVWRALQRTITKR